MANNSHKFLETDITVAQTATVSAAFSLQPWTTFVGINFPNIDAGNVGLDYSVDNGSNYRPILDPVDGDDLLVVTSGADPGVIDISDFLRFIPRGYGERKLRFTCAAQNSAAVTLVLTEAS